MGPSFSFPRPSAVSMKVLNSSSQSSRHFSWVMTWGDFQREDETGRGFVGPSGDGGAGGRAVEGTVHFDGAELRGGGGSNRARRPPGGVARGSAVSNRTCFGASANFRCVCRD